MPVLLKVQAPALTKLLWARSSSLVKAVGLEQSWDGVELVKLEDIL